METETPYNASGVEFLERLQPFCDIEQVTPSFPLEQCS